MAPRTGRHVQQQRQPGENGAFDVNSVRGPTSALTSFLREQGITGPGVTRRGNRTPTNAQTAEGNAEASTSGPATPSTVEASSSTAAATPAQDEAMVAESSTSATKKRKKATTGTAKKGKKGGKGDDDGERDENDMEQWALPPAKKGKYDDRVPGAITACGECGKKFTVSKYTVSNPNGPGMLCSKCTSEGVGPSPVKAAVKKATKKKAFKPVDENESRPIKTLQQSCIAVVGKHIDNVEALGDVGPKNLDKIAKIVCKHRALSNNNLRLFLDVAHTSLTLYDCTEVTEPELATFASFCPHLEAIDLRMCGRLDDSVIEAWTKGLPNLKHLSLYGAYLVTSDQWQSFFKNKPNLETFRLQQSARFNDDCIKALVKYSPEISSLQLSEIGRLSDDSLGLLHSLKNLTRLDISRAGVNQGNVLTDDAVVALLEQVGENLHELILDQNLLLTDRVLLEGVKVHCPRVRHLGLDSMREIQSAGFEALFHEWVNTGLYSVDVHRCLLLENEAIMALIAHSGHSLTSLNLHSVDEIDETALFALAKSCPRLERLDVSFVRAVDNFVVKAFLDGLPELKTLFVHGNNRVTDECPQKRGISIRGLENQKYADY